MSTFMRLAAAAALCCVLAFAPSARAQATAPADPAVWGLFAQLAGTEKQAGPDGYRLHWRWEVPGAVLVQEFLNPGTGKLAHTNTIKPGPGPGTLHVKGSYLAGKEWDGTVQADGSVVLVGRGLLKTPHRMLLTDDGAMEIRLVKLKAGQVVSESPATKYNRFTPLDAANATTTANAAAPADAQALAATVPTPAPAPPAPPQPRTAEELEAQAAALQEQAAALRRAQADAEEQEAGATAQAEIAQLEQAARDAEASADAAQQKVEEARAFADAANPPKSKPRPWVKGADNRDWWSFCGYGVDGGDSFITQLIHQRIYKPYDGPAEEYDAYEGPNRVSDVEARFTNAMQTSGLVPQGGIIGVNCQTSGSRDGAEWRYQQAKQQDPVPRLVIWRTLESEAVEGSLNLPTLEELNEMKRAAKQARVDAEVARSRAEGAAKLEAARAKSRQRKRDCEAGVPGACTASKQ